MKTQTYTTIDRTGWPAGEWDGEPDKMQWPDAATGLPCLAVRHDHFGHWCGYVGVAEGHPLYKKDGDALDVHGGVTFTDMCNPADTEDRGICHVPGDGEPDHVWWLGFDCCHAGDSSPRDAMNARDRPGELWALRGEPYRTLAYVQDQCAQLAAQIKETK